jgi:hypothetical protein
MVRPVPNTAAVPPVIVSTELVASVKFDPVRVSNAPEPTTAPVPPVTTKLVVGVLVRFPVENGRSAATNALKVGWAAAPVVGPAKTRFAVSVLSVNVRVPLVVTGELVMLYIGVDDPSANPIDVTVPAPAT